MTPGTARLSPNVIALAGSKLAGAGLHDPGLRLKTAGPDSWQGAQCGALTEGPHKARQINFSAAVRRQLITGSCQHLQAELLQTAILRLMSYAIAVYMLTA